MADHPCWSAQDRPADRSGSSLPPSGFGVGKAFRANKAPTSAFAVDSLDFVLLAGAALFAARMIDGGGETELSVASADPPVPRLGASTDVSCRPNSRHDSLCCDTTADASAPVVLTGLTTEGIL